MENYVEKVLCIEVVEKISRLRTYLLSHHSSSKTEGKEVVGIFLKSLEATQENFSGVINYLEKAAPLNYSEKASVLRRISMAFATIVKLHDQLQLIYGSWVRPETHTFIKEVLEFFPPERKPQKVNIVLTNKYNFLEGNLTWLFDSILRRNNHISINLKKETPTVFLPKLDYNNPLNWAILAHECGHTDTKGIETLLNNNQLITSDLDEDYVKYWAEEIYCDLIASKILGPAYLASFCTYALLVSGIEGNELHCDTHPASTLRISIIYEYLNNKGIEVPLAKELLGCQDVASYYFTMLEEHSKVSRKFLNSYSSLQSNSEAYPVDLTGFVDIISEQVDNIVKLDLSLSNADFIRIKILKERLSSGITIASYQEPDKLEKARNDYPKEDLQLDDLNTGKMALQETRAKLWEIINAGWLNKIEWVFPNAIDLFFSDKHNNLDFDEKLERFGNELASYDRVVLKSIESSEIFKIMEE